MCHQIGEEEMLVKLTVNSTYERRTCGFICEDINMCHEKSPWTKSAHCLDKYDSDGIQWHWTYGKVFSAFSTFEMLFEF